MEPQTPTDHIALMSLMMVRILCRRMHELGLLDQETRRHIVRLAKVMRSHAETEKVDISVLLDNLIKAAGHEELVGT